MKRISLILILSAVLAVASTGEVPRTLSYQGVLRDSGGDLVEDGSYSIRFLIYDDESGGALLWSETQNLPVADGLFNAVLGSDTLLGLDFDETYWLGISVNGGAEMTPRTILTSTPYTFRAIVADSVVGGGGAADSDWMIAGNDMYSGVTGNVGIGVTSPSRKLEVAGAAAVGSGLYGRGSGIGLRTSTGGYGIWVRSGGQVGLCGQSHWGGMMPDLWGPDVHVNTGVDTAYVWLGGTLATAGEMPARLDFVGQPAGYATPTAFAGISAIIGPTGGVARGHLVFHTATGSMPTPYAERMRLTDTGRLGIGLTNPAEKLDVDGAVRLSTTTSTNPGTIRWTGTDFEGYTGLGWYSLTALGDGDWNISGDDMYSNVSGYVGIGTSSPSDLLEIAGASGDGLTLSGVPGGDAPLITIDNPDNGSPSVLTAGDGSAFNVEYPAATRLLSLDTSGNLGVGTDTPEEKLQVIGRINSKSSGGESTALEMWGNANAGVIDVLNPAAGNGLYLRTGGSNGVFISDAQNVGIGGADATYRLNILSSGGNNAKIRLEGDSDDDPSINFQDDSSQRAVVGWDASDVVLKLKAETGMGGSTGINVEPGGYVGIGTVTPDYDLHVEGDIYASGNIYGTVTSQNDGDWTVLGPFIYPTSALFVGIGIPNPTAALSAVGIVRATYSTDEYDYVEMSHDGDDGYINWHGAGDLHFRYDGDTLATLTQNGELGIGTSTPAYHLTVSGQAGFDDFLFHNDDDDTHIRFDTDKVGLFAGGLNLVEADAFNAEAVVNEDGGEIDFRVESQFNTHALYLRGGDGYVGIGTSNPQTELDVVGTTRTDVLEVNGGSDLAEPFTISGEDVIQPGAVVVIDDKNPGSLCLSDIPYDKRVAGIVSGAGGIKTGLTLKQVGMFDSGRNVALTGRVMCLADASFAPIEPGDRLTTSTVPGHAMKVTDNGKAPGSVIGKAMTPLKEGRGLVLVLVQPQ